jgi:hypothetical protein
MCCFLGTVPSWKHCHGGRFQGVDHTRRPHCKMSLLDSTQTCNKWFLANVSDTHDTLGYVWAMGFPHRARIDCAVHQGSGSTYHHRHRSHSDPDTSTRSVHIASWNEQRLPQQSGARE